ncbi:helix-turn-helix domain-containing protein [Paucibacter sp. XJ19-41]|uniref:helix-turn-helix domain-containing protein n=1 Tax=Paucibacter sp. XJ19-41 TaxID=2927824 RepID=UPI002349151D|nr:helix-turn-helix domain-containing protein [Paucibacter sp. XJ19-41]MDC6169209.1 helix-turn-helix domain-containing protein [Paucibacter sp. XJ19-41]
MSSPELLLQVLRSEMRAANMTYRGLAERLDLSESSIKRMFSQGDMSLSRLAQVCKVIGVALEDVLRQAADAAPQSDTLTLAQERALVADAKLLMVATCCLGHWTLEQIIETYAISEAECIGSLLKLDRLALIELKPLNRYRLRVSRAFRWLPDGPVQQLMRQHVVGDYFAGRFDGPGETMLCVHGRLSDPSAQELVQKIQQLAAELARLHQDDQRLQPALRDGYTLLLGLRSWEFSQFTAMRR